MPLFLYRHGGADPLTDLALHQADESGFARAAVALLAAGAYAHLPVVECGLQTVIAGTGETVEAHLLRVPLDGSFLA